jgi:Flp pilus assembly pilin Flp
MNAVYAIGCRLLHDEDAAVMAEYVFLLSMIGLIVIGAGKFLGSSAGNKLNKVSTNISTSS